MEMAQAHGDRCSHRRGDGSASAPSVDGHALSPSPAAIRPRPRSAVPTASGTRWSTTLQREGEGERGHRCGQPKRTYPSTVPINGATHRRPDRCDDERSASW